MSCGKATPAPSARPVRRWVFFGLAVVVGLVCIRLGIWQLDRLSQRRAQNAAARTRLDLPAIGLPEDLSESENLAYRRALATGTFDASHEIYLTSRSLDGIAGVRVVTPLLLEEGGPAVLVDRGWIADEAYRSGSSQAWVVKGPVEVSGMLLPSQREPALGFLADRVPAVGEPALKEWRALSIPGIRQQLPYPVLDVYLMQESPASGPGGPTTAPELDLSEGPHLSYAAQWFAFATIALVGGVLWLRRGAHAAR